MLIASEEIIITIYSIVGRRIEDDDDCTEHIETVIVSFQTAEQTDACSTDVAAD